MHSATGTLDGILDLSRTFSMQTSVFSLRWRRRGGGGREKSEERGKREGC